MEHHQPSGLAFWLVLISLLLTSCKEQTEVVSRHHDAAELGVAVAEWQTSKTGPTLLATKALVAATEGFLESPTAESRLDWQRTWTAAHDSFMVASILHSPSASTTIDSWPIEPGFLDSLPVYPTSGIVNDSTLEITLTTLREQHLITDESEVALGFHVLEYYSFSREPQDFLDDGPAAGKRANLVTLVAEILLEDITAFTLSQEFLFESAEASYPRLLVHLQKRVQALFSEFNLLGEHSPYSETSTQNIGVQLAALAELLDEPVGLNHYLIDINPIAATTFNDTLREALTLLPIEGVPDEATFARLLLLIASLSQQLEDVVSMLPGEGEV